MILVVLTLAYAALIAVEVNRILSFDELITYHIAQAPTLARLFDLLIKWDLNPPIVHLLAHHSMRLLGESAFAVRLPSILEFYGASLFLFAYMRSKVGEAYAAIPLLIIWYSSTFQYATEARPYAFLCFCFCCLLWCWNLTSTSRYRGPALWGAAVSNLGLIGSHVFAPLSIAPFWAAELVRWRQRRTPDYPLWAALLLPAIGVLGYIPLYSSYKTIAFYPPAFQGSLRQIIIFYGHVLKTGIVCLVVGLLGARLASKKLFSLQPVQIGLPDLVLFGVLAINPIILNIVLIQDHAAFWPRYVITSTFALYTLTALVLAGALGYRTRSGYAVSLVLLALLLTRRVGVPTYQSLTHSVPDRTAAALAEIKPDLPMVAASGLTFAELGHYGRPAILRRLVYLRDRAAAIKYANATMFEDLDRVQKDFKLPGQVKTYADFTQTHRRFLVLGTPDYPEDWLFKKLADDQASIKELGRYDLPYKDRTLYEVVLQ